MTSAKTDHRGARFGTFPHERTLLGVARTPASTSRVLDVLTLVRGDIRVGVDATIARGSQFARPVAGLLTTCGIDPVSWEQATDVRYDLALAASVNGPLHELNAPLMLVPHGAGHNKYAPGSKFLSDLDPGGLLHNGEVVPSVIMLPGGESSEILRRDCHQAYERSRRAGDLTLWRLRTSAHLRQLYRAELGVKPWQSLVVVASTWGRESLAGRHWDLPADLLAQLPMDEWRVAQVLHPNITAWHSQYEVDQAFASAARLGLLTIPSDAGWEATLLAADVVIGDYGSLSMYAADSAPVLITTHNPTEYPSDGPMAALISSLPQLHRDQNLTAQLEAAIEGYRPDALRSIISRSIDVNRDAAKILRSAIYEHLELDEPDSALALEIEPPHADSRPVTSVLVDVKKVDTDTMRLRRVPAVSRDLQEDEHLLVYSHETARRPLGTAAVMVDSKGIGAAALLRERQGRRVVVVPGTARQCELHTRRGRFTATMTEDGPEVAAIAGSIAYRFLRHDIDPPERITVDWGRGRAELTFTRSLGSDLGQDLR